MSCFGDGSGRVVLMGFGFRSLRVSFGCGGSVYGGWFGRTEFHISLRMRMKSFRASSFFLCIVQVWFWPDVAPISVGNRSSSVRETVPMIAPSAGSLLVGDSVSLVIIFKSGVWLAGRLLFYVRVQPM